MLDGFDETLYVDDVVRAIDDPLVPVTQYGHAETITVIILIFASCNTNAPLANQWFLLNQSMYIIFSNMERLHGRADKALANHFGGPGSIPSTGCRRVNQTEKYSLPCWCCFKWLQMTYEPYVKPLFNYNFNISGNTDNSNTKKTNTNNT